MVEYFIHRCYLKKTYDYADFESFHLEESDGKLKKTLFRDAFGHRIVRLQ